MLRDREAATACYVYVPQHINVGHTCPPSGPCVPVINSQMGSISCVKDSPIPARITGLPPAWLMPPLKLYRPFDARYPNEAPIAEYP